MCVCVCVCVCVYGVCVCVCVHNMCMFLSPWVVWSLTWPSNSTCRYVKGLHLLHEDSRAWINSNRDNDKPVIPDEVLKQILGNIGSLVNLNSGLLNDLEVRMANW